MDFQLSECRVRIAIPEDKADLLRVAKGIWGGTDYLPKVVDRWISEPWFWVCEYRSRVIACLKMTLFPDNVLWFEGLRVHVRYQNHGIATLMNHSSFDLARKLRTENPKLRYEFCTYYQNVESLHLTHKLGFGIVEKFYDLRKHGIKATREPRILKNIDLKLFHNYSSYIPCSWQSVHNTPASIPFLKRHGSVFRTPQAAYYLGGLHEPSITLLEPPTPSIKDDLPYFQHFFGSLKTYGVILPQAWRDYLPFLQQYGFRFWDEEVVENMLVLQM